MSEIVNGNFIKLNRSLKNSRVFKNPDLLKVWIWCLMKARWKEEWRPMTVGRGKTEVHLMPGQFIFGRLVASQELDMEPSSVRNRMEKLKKIGNVDIQPDSHFSIVTILNWDIYQSTDNQNGQPSGQAKDNQRTTKGQPKDNQRTQKRNTNTVNTDKEIKEDINIAERILEFASTLELPAIRGKSSRQKVISAINARLKDGIPESDLKAHLSRYEAKKKIHLEYLNRHTEKPEILSLAWCPSTTWRVIDILSPDRFDKYFSIWEEEGTLDLDSTIEKCRNQLGGNNGTNKGQSQINHFGASSDDRPYEDDEVFLPD